MEGHKAQNWPRYFLDRSVALFDNVVEISSVHFTNQPVLRRMINVDAALGQGLIWIAVGEGVTNVETPRVQGYIFWRVAAFESNAHI